MSAPESLGHATIRPWLIVTMLMAFAFLGHFNRVSIPVAGNERLIGPNQMTSEELGVVYSTFLIVYTFGMLPGGWLIDLVGPRLALAGMGLGLGFCGMLTGALGWSAIPIAELWLPLLAVRGCAGLASVPLHPGAARSVALWVPLANRSTANGLVTAGALVGIAVCYPLFGQLMDWLDWPLAFVVSGAMMMLFALLWLWLTRCQAGLSTRAGDVPARATSGTRDLFNLLGSRHLLLLAASYAALSYFQYLFFYWIERYFEKELRLEVSDSRAASFTVMMAMAIGMAGGGYATDYLSRRLGLRWGSRSMALAGMGLCALFGWQGAAAVDSADVVALFALAMGALGMCECVFWTAAPIIAARNGGLACAFLNTIGNAGGLLAPVLSPWIAADHGWTTAIRVACLISAVGALLWLLIDCRPASGSDHLTRFPGNANALTDPTVR